MNRTLVLDSRASDLTKKTLISMGYNIVYMPKNKCFDEAICAHPDIFMTEICGTWFIDNAVKEMFTFLDSAIFCEREVPDNEKMKYPFDCAFNCVQVGNHLICNQKITHKNIIEFAIENQMNIINTKQGYSKCSICKVSENAIITEDKQICDLAVKNGINVLHIKKGYVKLYGYDYGFVGGCSGLIENNLLAFNGDVRNHPDADAIIDFCHASNVEVVCLNDDLLYDIGTIIRI